MNLKPDKPLPLEETDDLYKKCTAIKQFLESDESQDYLDENNIIALYGKWGSGKSSIFRTLSDKIDKDKYIPIIFEAWKYEKDKELPSSLIDAILNKIISFDKALFDASKDVFGAILRAVKVKAGIPGVVTIESKDVINEIDKVFTSWDKSSLYNIIENQLDDASEVFSKSLKNKKALVLIDDLDRCDDENIIYLLSSLKLMLSFKEVIFICGIDREAVCKTLEGKYQDKEKSEKYLEKIFNMEFNIYDNMNNSITRNRATDIIETKNEILSSLGVENPREINKIFNKYNLLVSNIPQASSAVNCAEQNDRFRKFVLFTQVILFIKNKYNFQYLDKVSLDRYLEFIPQNIRVMNSSFPLPKEELECHELFKEILTSFSSASITKREIHTLHPNEAHVAFKEVLKYFYYYS